MLEKFVAEEKQQQNLQPQAIKQNPSAVYGNLRLYYQLMTSQYNKRSFLSLRGTLLSSTPYWQRRLFTVRH